MTNKNIPAEILEDLEILRSTIRGCDQALESNLETWERKEFRETRQATVDKLAAREAAIATWLELPAGWVAATAKAA